MSDSVWPWIFIALVLFWAMGAYNRLVRLRTQSKMSFVALEGLLNQYVLIVKTNYRLVEIGMSLPEVCHGNNSGTDAWVGLSEAAEQFNTLLRAVHALPLNESTMRALGTALGALRLCWSQLLDLPPDLAGPVLPGTLQLQWERLEKQVDTAQAEFSKQVVNYNAAIDQFPAVLMARIFGFKPAQPI